MRRMNWVPTEKGSRLEGTGIEVTRTGSGTFPWEIWEHGIPWHNDRAGPRFSSGRDAQWEVEKVLKWFDSLK